MIETVRTLPAPVLDIAAISAAVPEGFQSSPLRDYYRAYYAIECLPIAGADKRMLSDLVAMAIEAGRDATRNLG